MHYETQGMILAIVGSTKFENPSGLRDAAASVIRQEIETREPTAVISGGAAGLDQLAQQIAREEYLLPVLEAQPARRAWRYFKARNELVAALCDELVRIAHPLTTTYGSGWTADLAEKLGKPVTRHQL